VERTEKFRIWFQAASELKRKENMDKDTFYAKPLAVRVNLSRRNWLSQNDLLPKQRVQ